MVVRTTSGSHYFFTEKGGKTYFTKNLIMEGIVESIEGLKVGSRLTIRFHECNLYTCKPQEDVSVIVTSPIKEILY